jgi:uncharacterized protein YbcV (DUF1398 family)
MHVSTEKAIRELAEASNEGRTHFGAVVSALAQAGVESYDVDYRACRTTYYLPSGETLALEQHAPDAGVAATFDAAAVQAAIRGAQSGAVLYPEFKRLSQLGGCVGYTVWIAGRHVTYFGRNGETHVERFPD